MGMEGIFKQVSPQKLKEFQKNPTLAYKQILPELSSILPSGLGHIEGFAQALEESLFFGRQQLGVVSKVSMDAKAAKRATAQFDKIANRMVGQAKKPKASNRGTQKLFSLYKDWHVLHYLLNGTGEAGESPLEKSILGGTEFPIPADYGPMRYLTAIEVKEITFALAKVDPKTLLARVNRPDAEAKQIYGASRMDDPTGCRSLPELFEDFRRFYQSAADNGNAMLLKIV